MTKHNPAIAHTHTGKNILIVKAQGRAIFSQGGEGEGTPAPLLNESLPVILFSSALHLFHLLLNLSHDTFSICCTPIWSFVLLTLLNFICNPILVNLDYWIIKIGNQFMLGFITQLRYRQTQCFTCWSTQQSTTIHVLYDNHQFFPDWVTCHSFLYFDDVTALPDV